MDTPPPIDTEQSKLREELLRTVAAIFDQAVEIGRRQGAEAVLATINDAARRMAGLSSGGFAAMSSFSGTATALRAGNGNQAPDAKEGRARSGAVQEGVLKVLGVSPTPLAPLRIVDAGKAMGLDLKPSSVRMALATLSKAGRVAQDAHGDYHLAPGGKVAQGNAPGAESNQA